jgi:hypothetical protein
MTTLYQWAARHGVTLEAIKELERVLGTEPPLVIAATGLSEAAIQQNVRLEASRIGARLWRNNVGGYKDEYGNFIRYGLANESAQVNKVMKSSDLIGIKPVLVTPAMVGHTIGQFLSREVKAGDWTYSGSEHEVAQLAWINLITSLGGDAKFTNGGL